MEKSFSESANPLQILQPYVHDEQVDKLASSLDTLPYLKLHGCFDHMGPGAVPLVITPEQYLDYEQGRKSVFDTFEEWARKFTFVFVGYGAQDLNVRHYITRLVTNIDDRMRFYFVRPGWETPEKRLWETRKVTAIDADFDAFLLELDRLTIGEFRGFKVDIQMPPSLQKHFTSDTYALSENAAGFLKNRGVFVDSIDPDMTVPAKAFFDGNSDGWTFIAQNWDVMRSVSEDIIIEVFLDNERFDEPDCRLIVLRGYAGSGKTVALKRLAWELVKEHDGLGVFVERPEDLNSGALAELAELTGKHIYVFIDDLGTAHRSFRNCVRGLSSSSSDVTFIAGVRTSDWNLTKNQFGYVSIKEYEIGDLIHREILEILDRLQKTDCLGELEGLDLEDQISKFRDVAQRNLLVALYEATRGKSFEDIILDEFDSIGSEEAKSVYLSICILNRLKVPVRATLISRIHSLPYSEFRSRLFDPLDGIVSNYFDRALKDYVYSARHPYIAEIVFRTVLIDQHSRFEEYHKVIRSLNMAYTCDEIAFRELIRGRVLNDLFSDPSYVEEIYKIAEIKRANDPNIFHQRAVFEMNRKGGDLSLAQDYLERALFLESSHPYAKHSMAELFVRRSEETSSLSARERYLRKAEKICRGLSNSKETSHVKHTLAKIGISRARTYLETHGNNILPSAVNSFVKSAQLDLESSLQVFPGDSYLLDAKAKLARVIGETTKVLESLELAFKANPQIGYIAMQLHQCYLEKGELDKADAVLKACLDENRNNRQVNYTYGKFLMEHRKSPVSSILYLKRSFVPGDTNFDAQLRYGRECFSAREFDECERHFLTVRATRFPPRLGSESFYPTEEWWVGVVTEVHARFLVIRESQSGSLLRSYFEDSDPELFRIATQGKKVEFRVAVSLHGLRACETKIYIPLRADEL